jgi:hypothetical protein
MVTHLTSACAAPEVDVTFQASSYGPGLCQRKGAPTPFTPHFRAALKNAVSQCERDLRGWNSHVTDLGQHLSMLERTRHRPAPHLSTLPKLPLSSARSARAALIRSSILSLPLFLSRVSGLRARL